MNLRGILATGLVLLWMASLTRHASGNETFENSLRMKLVRIQAGTFGMGSPPNEPGRRPDETLHRVKITRNYDLGQFEVTRGQFRTFVEATGYLTESERNKSGGYGVKLPGYILDGLDPKYSWRSTGFEQTDRHPVVNVSWNDATAFCEWLSKKKLAVYRLPTEAEWEYACRAGSTSTYPFGESREQLVRFGNVVDADAHAVFPDRIALKESDGHILTAPVGSYQANAWGLHDMQGNVWEWCSDWFAPHGAEDQVDPRGPAEPQSAGRAIKGGDWYHDWSFARPAQRFPIPPALVRRHAGFRVVRELPQ
ncbi:MAG: Sulphatase-modifying factor protein [Planctomycetaceae bacterium]|nr:Sulphatase-modifying factor protein [Planctomycetaceae bacterium]